jgi:hypothetical protein
VWAQCLHLGTVLTFRHTCYGLNVGDCVTGSIDEITIRRREISAGEIREGKVVERRGDVREQPN